MFNSYYPEKPDTFVKMEVREIDQKLIDAVNLNQLGKIRELVENGADVNAKTAFGTPVILLTVIHTQLAACKLLVELGANVFAEDSKNKTIFAHAYKCRNPKMQAYLQELYQTRGMSKVISTKEKSL